MWSRQHGVPRRRNRFGHDHPGSFDFVATPSVAASLGYVVDVIMPRETRKRIIRTLGTLKNRKLENPWKKHDNIPL